MASQRTANEDLASRLSAIEDELASQRRALVALAQRTGAGDLDALIEELADVPMSEEEMEAAFKRLDLAADLFHLNQNVTPSRNVAPAIG